MPPVDEIGLMTFDQSVGSVLVGGVGFDRPDPEPSPIHFDDRLIERVSGWISPQSRTTRRFVGCTHRL